MNKKIVLLLVFVLALSLMAGIGFSKVRTITIGWCPPDITGVFKTATDFMNAAAADAKKSGLDVRVISHSASSHTSIGDQVKNIEDFIQSKADVIMVSPIEVQAVIPVLKEVNKAGIPLILVNMLTAPEGVKVDSFIGFDNQQSAAVSAYAMLNALGGPGVLDKGKVVPVKKGEYLDLNWWENVYKDVDKNSIKGNIAEIDGIAGDFFSNERAKGFSSVIDKFPNVKIVQSLPADWNRQKAITAAENILQSHPKGLDAIWASCGEMAMGAMIAVKNAGREKEVMVLSNDGTPESIVDIRQGKILAETWHGFPDWGWYGTKFGVMLALGENVPQIYDIRPRTEYKGNADNFYPNPSLEKINWKEIIKNAKK